MVKSLPTVVIQQKRTDAVLAGMTWLSIFSTDLKEREQIVQEHVQEYGLEQICVLETPFGLQLGYCERPRLPMDAPRNQRWISFALLVRRHFHTDRLLLVWYVKDPQGQSKCAVIIFEEESIVLDRVMDAASIGEMIRTYMDNVGDGGASQLLTNDLSAMTEFPGFSDISDLDWLAHSYDHARLRPPRAPRLIDVEKRPVQAIALFVLLIAASLLVSWYLWTQLISKPPVVVKAKPSAQSLYLQKVTEQMTTLGFDSGGVRDLIMELMTLPLTHEGWHLQSVQCDLKSCILDWQGLAGSDPRALDLFGEEVTDKRAKSAASQSSQRRVKRDHPVAPSGLATIDQFRSRHDARLMCQREVMILRNLKLRATANCAPLPWPDKAPGVGADLMVERYPLKVQADWISIDRLLDRYSGLYFWREVRLTVYPKSRNLPDLLQFELNGEVHGYR